MEVNYQPQLVTAGFLGPSTRITAIIFYLFFQRKLHPRKPNDWTQTNPEKKSFASEVPEGTGASFFLNQPLVFEEVYPPWK